MQRPRRSHIGGLLQPMRTDEDGRRVRPAFSGPDHHQGIAAKFFVAPAA
jgi:hypothetical protein